MLKADHIYRINDVLSVIHNDISADLRAKTLAESAAYSEQHFHRLFKQVTGESVHQYVRRTRLEAAANQLMFTNELSVQTVAVQCGFSSLSSFSRAFKSVYGVTPGGWRAGEKYDGTHYFLSDPAIKEAYQHIQASDLPEPDIVQLEPRRVAYIRHTGYGRSISQSWQTIKTWAVAEERVIETQIGLHHSNPAFVPLEQCRYVACIGIDRPVLRRGQINSLVIPGGLHAAFQLSGKYGELLPYISHILAEWLPQSGFVAKTTPAFAHYHKNQFLSEDDKFELVFYLPIMSAGYI